MSSIVTLVKAMWRGSIGDDSNNNNGDSNGIDSSDDSGGDSDGDDNDGDSDDSCDNGEWKRDYLILLFFNLTLPLR